MILAALVGAINNDPTTLAKTVGLDFPRHLNEDVCMFLIVGSGYFDFKGRHGLIQILTKFVPESHYLCATIKDAQYKSSIEKLVALQNCAAHDSQQSKDSAIKSIEGENLRSAGKWLRTQDRFISLCDSLKKLASEIEKKAPY